MKVIGTVRLAPGKVGYFDQVTRIHLTISSPEKQVTDTMNTENLKRAVKTGAIKLVSGSLNSETVSPAVEPAVVASAVAPKVTEVIEPAVEEKVVEPVAPVVEEIKEEVVPEAVEAVEEITEQSEKTVESTEEAEVSKAPAKRRKK
jgi:hypothetical protein